MLREENFDFDETKINANASIILRKRLGISIDECARFCATENSFDCQVISYSPADGECKWSSLLFFNEISLRNETDLLIASTGYALFTSGFFIFHNPTKF